MLAGDAAAMGTALVGVRAVGVTVTADQTACLVPSLVAAGTPARLSSCHQATRRLTLKHNKAIQSLTTRNETEKPNTNDLHLQKTGSVLPL